VLGRCYLFEQKYSIGTRDGQHQIIWDITALLQELKNANIPVHSRNVSDLAAKNNFFGNPGHAMDSDIEIPCIIALLCDGIEKLIDGNHRLYKAKKMNLETIPCYVLQKEYHTKFIVNYDSESYDKVIMDFVKINGVDSHG